MKSKSNGRLRAAVAAGNAARAMVLFVSTAAMSARAQSAANESKIPAPPPPFAPDIKSSAPVYGKPMVSPSPMPSPKQAAASVLDANQAKADVLAESSIRVDDLASLMFDEVEGSLWVRGQNYKAQFNEEGFTFIPFMGELAAKSYPVHFTLQSVNVGNHVLAMASGAEPVRSGADIVYHRGAFAESYRISFDSIEQTFVFHSKPSGNGDLVLRMNITTELTAGESASAIQFSNEFGRVQYTHAVSIDASDVQTPLQTRLQNGAIEITLPAPVLNSASYPLTIDPIISNFPIQGVNQLSRWPDVAYDATEDGYLVVWEYHFSATDGDIYCRRFDSAGNPLESATAIDLSTENWRHPKVANNNLANNYLVVAERGTAPSRDIWGRTRAANGTSMSAPFAIGGTFGGDEINPDVGGDPALTGPTYFYVIWERALSATDHDVHGRLVNSNATNQGGVVFIDNSLALDVAPRISKSDGQPPFPSQNWTIVWQREFSPTDHEIFGSQVRWDGAITFQPFIIEVGLTDDLTPAVSTILNEDGAAMRFYMVVYEQVDEFGFHYINSKMYDGNKSWGGWSLTHAEAVNMSVARRRPVASSNNLKFVAAHEEHVSGSDWNAYISHYCPPIFYAAEQHRRLAATTSVEGQLNIAGVHEAGGNRPLEFMTVWSKIDSVTGLGEIHAARYNTKNSCCRTDLDDSGATNINDLLIVIGQWAAACTNCAGDIHGDMSVDINDLLEIINGWGTCFF